MMTQAARPISQALEEASETSKTGQLLKAVRQLPLVRQLVPQEAGIGWPVPVRKNGQVYIMLPFYGLSLVSMPDKRQTILFPPFATLTLNWVNQVPVEYVNLRFRNPAPELNWETQAGTFPHEALAQMTIGEYKAKRNELLDLYDELFEMLLQSSTFPDEWCERFSQLLNTLLEPGLEPYYRTIASKFFDRFLN